MQKNLVIVESPAKAKTLGRILGKDYIIKASLGHIRDLPKGTLGIDIENDFTPTYVIPAQRRKTVSQLKESASETSAVYLATDPDREGEAISWHLIEAADLNKDKIPVYRVVFHELTREAVQNAFNQPHSINMSLVDAQQARRLLDRLVGYKLSPLLWKKVQKGLSAGRVQSAAVRIIVDREREINDFVSVEYWTIEAELTRKVPEAQKPGFRALLTGYIDGTRIEISNKKEVNVLISSLEKADYTVAKVQVKDVTRQPAPPFTTSTLQQEAWRRLRFTAKRTMAIAQQLYEGISIGKEGSIGLITYMRTDSTHVASSAITETREFIGSKYGSNYLPRHPRTFGKAGKWSQEAHEAIRPTRTHREPEKLSPYLKPEQMKLYDLIWKRMVASQMSSAIFDTVSAEINAICQGPEPGYILKTTSSNIKFPGFMLLYSEGKDDDSNGEDDENKEMAAVLRELKANDELVLLDLFPEQNFTQPPPRYNEATLIKALEQKGIGRPSTYAPIISTIQEREYVHKENGKFQPDDIGMIVNDLLSQHFPNIVDLNFTAKMEKELDDIAVGKKKWIKVLKDFYAPFNDTLQTASNSIERINYVKMTNEICPEPGCGRPMVVKTGRFGRFLACSGYPECTGKKPYIIKTGVPCPQPDCDGEIVERISKKKRTFYGCSRYPKCKFISNNRPIPKPCPRCGKLLTQSKNDWIKCMVCNFKGKLADLEKEKVGETP